MSIKHIVVQADDRKPAERRLKLAIAVANRFGASLEAVFPRTPPYLPLAMDGAVSAQILDAQRESMAEAEAAAKAIFDGCIGALASKDATWTVREGPAVNVFNDRARYADLVVVGQTDPDTQDSAIEYDLAAQAVMDAGRPVLIVPYAGDYEASFENVVVAWNRSREATRAIGDAMPFIEAAKKVTVLSVNLKPRPGESDEPGTSLVNYFARHGIEAENSQFSSTDMDPGDLILSRVADLGADLIVMGGYGRSRLRELILGGATHDILAHMTAPVMMSH